MAKQVYRYFHPKWADILVKKRIRMSRACDCNDPFEMMPRYDKILRREIESVADIEFAFTNPWTGPSHRQHREYKRDILPKMFEESMEVWPTKFQKEFSDRFGIICFAEKIDNLLMWAHYTDSHKGFALGFDSSDTFFNPQEFGKVKYDKMRPEVDVKDYTQILLRKSEEWDYEEEWRLIRDLQPLGHDSERYWLVFPFSALRGIYLGCRMPEKERQTLIGCVEQPEIKNVPVFEMQMDPVHYRVVPKALGSKALIPPEAYDLRDALWDEYFGTFKS